MRRPTYQEFRLLVQQYEQPHGTRLVGNAASCDLQNLRFSDGAHCGVTSGPGGQRWEIAALHD